MQLAFDQTRCTALGNKRNGRCNRTLFTIGIDNLCTRQIPPDGSGVFGNLPRFPDQKRAGKPDGNRIARRFQRGGTCGCAKAWSMVLGN